MATRAEQAKAAQRGQRVAAQQPQGADVHPNVLEAQQADVAGSNPPVKQTKDAVDYRPAGSSQTNCKNCQFFVQAGVGAAGSCKLVDGPISPDWVCNLFQPWSPKPSLQDLIGPS